MKTGYQRDICTPCLLQHYSQEPRYRNNLSVRPYHVILLSNEKEQTAHATTCMNVKDTMQKEASLEKLPTV